ncbi:MAG: electron transfer flavoprotein subunit alpha/FixB family protein [Acetobacteraceae bacterium]|nr:electron transfer flavoprotein subunit alpha/FixB family protein [Acetobacteraceae bacterium]
MPSGIMLFAECRQGQLRKVTLELAGRGSELAAQRGEPLIAALLGQGVGPLAEALGQAGVDRVVVADHEALKDYTTDAYSRVMTDVVRAWDPAVVLFGATAIGRDLAPRVAARLGVGLASDCVALDLDAGKALVVKRPLYAGKVMATVGGFSRSPAMATVRPNVLTPAVPQPGRRAEVVEFSPRFGPEDRRTAVKELVAAAGEVVDLAEADVIVSGGRGLKAPENFRLIEELARALGGAVGASRAAVDAGWIEHSHQVGQTGKTVSPTLYVACGISGAIQHLAGMSSSRCIVAINKDPEAPIFKVADYGIVGDLFQVVPALTEEVKKLRAG